MAQIINLLYDQLLAGNYHAVFINTTNTYFAFGWVFWFLGFLIASVVQMKTKNLTYSGAIGTVYFMIISSSGLITSAYSMMAMKYFGLLLAAATALYTYRMIKGGR